MDFMTFLANGLSQTLSQNQENNMAVMAQHALNQRMGAQQAHDANQAAFLREHQRLEGGLQRQHQSALQGERIESTENMFEQKMDLERDQWANQKRFDDLRYMLESQRAETTQAFQQQQRDHIAAGLQVQKEGAPERAEMLGYARNIGQAMIGGANPMWGRSKLHKAQGNGR